MMILLLQHAKETTQTEDMVVTEKKAASTVSFFSFFELQELQT